MRHNRIAKKFGRSTSHRKALMSSLVTNLIVQSSIKTTLPKAKQARRDAEKMVTLARKGTLAARRLAASRLQSPKAVQMLFDCVVPAMDGRPGGYTFWDYQAGAWQKNNGIRIDHMLLSPEAADRLTAVGIDRAVRGRDKPSDHVPVWVELNLEAAQRSSAA